MTTTVIPAWVDDILTPVEKLLVHQKGLKHKAVSVFVMNKGRVLLQQRAMCKYHTPGLWANTCCTHPDWNEDPSDCAVRRLDDELGIKGLYPSHRGQIEYRADVGNGLIEHEVAEIYLANAPDDLDINPNPEEVMATRWVNYYDLAAEVKRKPDLFTPWLKIYLTDHARSIFGHAMQAV